MNLPIVVGVDGSEPSLRAVDWAADEAALRGAPLRLVHASLWERYEGALLAQELDKPLEEVMALDVVGVARHRAERRQPGLKVTTDVLPEEAEHGLVRESRSALAMVVGSRGRRGITEALLGSVSLTVAGHAHCPVIVLRGSHDNQARAGIHGRIVLGVCGKPAGSAAV
ncbi:universal stress protein, partial [Streptomyces sp. NPDC049099]|uniref:universal stress protein n=1 Tax=Streptomyces sp. NPDC049099 TaxID=3155768 RepID=UPI00342FDF65